jgi:ABC-2 type transport system permease protein
MGQRLVAVAMVLALFWPLLCGVFIYFSNHAELLGSVSPGFARFIEVKGRFFAIFMYVQSFAVLLLAALAGPGLIAPDLSNGGLPLYFSRPLSRLDYVLARLSVLAGLLSLVTWVPGAFLFTMQANMAGWDWFLDNWRLGAAMLSGFAIEILLVSLVALASSAYVKWRIIAGALVLAFFFVLSGLGEMVNAILRVDWGNLINPGKNLYILWNMMLGNELPEGPGGLESGLALLGFAAMLCWVLERKLRPVEVIS